MGLCLMVSGRWHRIALSVEGKNVTIYVDCEKKQTQFLDRDDNAIISTEGVTLFGTRLLDEEVFEVGLEKCAYVFCSSFHS